MSIQVNSNFNYKGSKPNFERDRFETLELMRSADERSLDNGHISYCIETGKHYVFNKNNTTLILTETQFHVIISVKEVIRSLTTM